MRKISLETIVNNDNAIFSSEYLVFAKFYYRVGYGMTCYLSSKNRNFPEIILPIEVGEIVEINDEKFGIMTGIFAYADYDAELSGVLNRLDNGFLYFSKIYSLRLSDGINSQYFEINLNY
ncbi:MULTISPECIES: hypothetical protein [unclassified Acinetobacter]|uniref:hypothetical protein n=1 Tax=unclassified Acinetobacter TaxID=196816 RepID=UPI0035B861A0